MTTPDDKTGPQPSSVSRVGRTGRVRKQYHFRPGEEGLDAWDVDRLIELTKNVAPEQVPLEDLPEIDSVYWFTSLDEPTVRRVVDHLRLIHDVDTSFPIIIGPDNRVMVACTGSPGLFSTRRSLTFDPPRPWSLLRGSSTRSGWLRLKPRLYV